MSAQQSDVLARWPHADAAIVRQARTRIKAALTERGIAEPSIADAELMVSELVTNALLHGAPPVSLALWISALGCAVVEVRDTARQHPVLPAPASSEKLEAEGSRGLTLVTAYSVGLCGVAGIPDQGKTVWFAIPIKAFLPSPAVLSAQIQVRLSAQCPQASRGYGSTYGAALLGDRPATIPRSRPALRQPPIQTA